MNRLSSGALLSVTFTFWLTANSGYAQTSKFEETRAHIEKWVQTRQLIAKKNADWRVEQESIRQSIGLLKKEREPSEASSIFDKVVKITLESPSTLPLNL